MYLHDFHQDWQKDKRCRFYLPVSRILKNDGVDNAEILIGNREFQTVIHYMPAIALFTPGSSLLIDFGKAIHGGIRFNNIFCSGRIRLEFGESISECIGNSNPDCSVKDTVLDLPHCGMLEYGNTVFRFVRVTNAGQENIKCLNILGVALEHDLETVPVINKIDLPSAQPEETKAEIEEDIGLDCENAPLISAKMGIGIEDVLEAIVTQMPPPEGDNRFYGAGKEAPVPAGQRFPGL